MCPIPPIITKFLVYFPFAAYRVVLFVYGVAPEYMCSLSHFMNGSYTGDIFADDLLKSS